MLLRKLRLVALRSRPPSLPVSPLILTSLSICLNISNSDAYHRRRWSNICSGWPNCGLPPIAGESNRSTWSRPTSSSATARPSLIRELVAQNGGKLRVVDSQSAYLPLEGDQESPESIRRQVKSLLQSELAGCL